MRAVVTASLPIRARKLYVPGMDRRSIQKRLERLRLEAGGKAVGDDALIDFATAELMLLGPPTSRGRLKLRELATFGARLFAQQAGLQATVIGDWVEIAHSPGDLGWQRSQIQVKELGKRTVLARGRTQSWLTEKMRFLRERWPEAQSNADLWRNLVPNQLKMDLVAFRAFGTEDSPLCSIEVAPVDWLTCFSLNSRLDSPALTDKAGRTLRECWGEPRRIVDRVGLPGMLVAHIVVETSDRRFIVCQRQAIGIEDEPGTWSLSIEERWSRRLHLLVDRAGQVIQKPREPDRHPHDVVKRALREELRLTVEDLDIRVLGWGIEASVLYPGFIAIARTSVGSWEMEGLRQHAADSNEIRLVASIPADLESVPLLEEDEFMPQGRPGLRRRWHRTSKARLFAALAHVLTREGEGDREDVLGRLGS